MTFAQLVGQDTVVRTLTTALETGRLAHAYLFSGPRGSGKTSAAKILARCIDCVHGPTATPDNTCENCRAILAGTALDVLEIDAASNRGIDEIRALRDAVKFAPSTMRKKVYIIDEAHMLTREGANAFLKTLEEPPDHAVFILATTAPEALPVTILSRCQRYAFKRIAIPTMIARMREIADAEAIPIGDDALAAIAYRADGGLRDALTMLEQVAAFADGPIDLETVEAAFGATGRRYARAIVERAFADDAVGALRAIEGANDEGADMAGLIRGAIGEVRHLLVGRIDPALLERELSPEDAAAARDAATFASQHRVVRALRLLMDALSASRASGNARLELETALLRFVYAGEDPTLDALAARVTALESGSPVAPRAVGSGAAPASPASESHSVGAPRASSSSPAGESTPKTPPVAPPSKPSYGSKAVSAAPPSSEASSSATASAKETNKNTQTAEPTLGSSPAVSRDSASPLSGEALRAQPSRGEALPGESPASTRLRETTEIPAERRPTEAAAERRPAENRSAERGSADGDELTLLKVRQKWDQVVTRVRGAKVSLGGAIGRANVAAYANGTITLEVGDKINQQILQGDTPLIVTSASDVYDRPIKIAVHLRGAHDEPAETPAAAPERGESENLLAVADQLFGLG